jgi:hypothetical protein
MPAQAIEHGLAKLLGIRDAEIARTGRMRMWSGSVPMLGGKEDVQRKTA